MAAEIRIPQLGESMKVALQFVACCACVALLTACDAQPIRHTQAKPRIYYLPASPHLTREGGQVIVVI